MRAACLRQGARRGGWHRDLFGPDARVGEAGQDEAVERGADDGRMALQAKATVRGLVEVWTFARAEPQLGADAQQRGQGLLDVLARVRVACAGSEVSPADARMHQVVAQ